MYVCLDYDHLEDVEIHGHGTEEEMKKLKERLISSATFCVPNQFVIKRIY